MSERTRAVPLGERVAALLRDEGTVKVLTTVDERGEAHAVFKESLHAGEEGHLIYLELLESSVTNRNMVRSLWYDRRVAVAIKGRDGESWQIKGTPVRAVIGGPLFTRYYETVREKLGDVDLAAVWFIRPEEVIDESLKGRMAEESAAHPYFLHLDRLARRT